MTDNKELIDYNALIDSIYDFDFTQFGNFNFTNITCWEELQMQADIVNATINESLLKFLMIFSLGSPTLFQTIEHGFKENDAILNFNSDIHCIECIYSIYDSEFFYKPLSIVKKVLACEFNSDQSSNNCIGFDKWNWYEELKNPNKKQLRANLINIIFDKHPVTILKFYNKWRKYLHRYDFPFVKYLSEKTKLLASNNPKFNDIYIELEKEIKNQLSIRMYLN